MLVQGLAVVLEQRLAEAVDAAQRPAQVVGHRVAERLELPVLAFELVHQHGPGLGHLAHPARLGGLDLPVQQLLADLAVLILELLAAELGAQPRLEHLEITRLGNVVVGPGSETLDHRLPFLQRGEHEQRNIPRHRRALDPAAGLRPAQPRHEQVEEDAVHRLPREHFDGFLARVGQDDLIPLSSEYRRQRVEVGDAVVDRENPLGPDQAGGGIGRRVGAAPHRRKARQHHLHVLRLANERIGPRIERADLRAPLVRCRQQDARDAAEGRVQADPADHGRAVDSGQHAVHEDRGGGMRAGHEQTVFPRPRGGHGVPGALERALELGPVGRAVIDDEHQRPVVGCRVRAVPQELTATGDDVPGVVGLAHVVVRAGLEPSNPSLDLRFRRQYQHRRVRQRGGADRTGSGFATPRTS